MLRKARRYMQIAAFVAALFSVSVAGAQGIRDTLFKRTDALMQQAKDADVELLSPENFKDAQDAYAKAEREAAKGRADKAQKYLDEVNEALNKGVEASGIAKVTFASTLKAREATTVANAAQYEPEMWQKAEAKFGSATRALEKGSVKSAQSKAAEASKLYSDAELAAIKTEILGTARKLLAQADDDRVERYAPITLTRAQALVKEAERALDKDRYLTAGPRLSAADAEYEVKHATYIAGRAKAIDKNDTTSEAVILEWEKALQDVARALGTSIDMSAGYAVASADAINRVNQLRTENEQKTARLNELEIQLGSSELVVEETARLNRQLKEVERQFSPDQAQVLREGNDLIIRLVGLSFPVGQATIQTEYFGLLRQVQRAIQIFEKPDVVVEGHTDSQGSDDNNMRLSLDRANAVREYLNANLRSGVASMTAIGYGETRPIASNETADGRSRNRRIDIVIKNARARAQ